MKAWHSLFLLLILGCTSSKIITYAHPNATFDRYQTYRIASHEKIAEVSAQGYETYQRIDTYIAQALEAKGYQYHIVADLVVEYKISSGLGQDTRNNYYDRYSWYYPDYSARGDTQQQMELLIEIVLKDRVRKKNAWTGSADLTLKRRRSENEEKIQLKIQEIFDRYPYTAKQ